MPCRPILVRGGVTLTSERPFPRGGRPSPVRVPLHPTGKHIGIHQRCHRGSAAKVEREPSRHARSLSAAERLGEMEATSQQRGQSSDPRGGYGSMRLTEGGRPERCGLLLADSLRPASTAGQRKSRPARWLHRRGTRSRAQDQRRLRAREPLYPSQQRNATAAFPTMTMSRAETPSSHLSRPAMGALPPVRVRSPRCGHRG